jgi:hypothetical protein
MARALLLAVALAVAFLLPLATFAQVSVVAPGTAVYVGWNGQSSSDGNNGNGNNNHDNGGRCGAHAQWVTHWGGCGGGLFHAELSGKKMVAPNSNTPAPIDTPASGHVWACWTHDKSMLITHLVLCNMKGYVSSHYHYGNPNTDFPPPIVAIEPEQKPADPMAPPTSLPALQPPLDIGGNNNDNNHHNYHDCRMVQTMSKASDLIVVPGGPSSWDDFAAAMQKGDVYVNAHSTSNVAGEIRGNLEAC